MPARSNKSPTYKDPTITVLAGSEAAYIFIYVDNSLPEAYFSLNYSSSWTAVATTGTKTLYVYNSMVSSPDEDITLDAIFTTVTVSSDITSEQIEALGEVQLTVQSYAVQAEGIDQETAIQMAAAFFEEEFNFSFSDVDTSVDISGLAADSEDTAETDTSEESADTDEASADEPSADEASTNESSAGTSANTGASAAAEGSAASGESSSLGDSASAGNSSSSDGSSSADDSATAADSASADGSASAADSASTVDSESADAEDSAGTAN